jgi:hypothetical protein
MFHSSQLIAPNTIFNRKSDKTIYWKMMLHDVFVLKKACSVVLKERLVILSARLVEKKGASVMVFAHSVMLSECQVDIFARFVEVSAPLVKVSAVRLSGLRHPKGFLGENPGY